MNLPLLPDSSWPVCVMLCSSSWCKMTLILFTVFHTKQVSCSGLCGLKAPTNSTNSGLWRVHPLTVACSMYQNDTGYWYLFITLHYTHTLSHIDNGHWRQKISWSLHLHNLFSCMNLTTFFYTIQKIKIWKELFQPQT